MTQQHGCQKHLEQEEPGTKEYILYDSIYIKFNNMEVNLCAGTQNNSCL